MAEDFTTWTEVDSHDIIEAQTGTPNHIQTDTSKVYFASYSDYFYKDYGAGGISGDFTIKAWIGRNVHGHGDYGPKSWNTILVISESLGRLDQMDSAFGIGWYKLTNSNTNRMYLFKVDSGNLYVDEYYSHVSPAGWKYAVLRRVGSNLFMDIYNNSNYDTLTDTKQFTGVPSGAFQYIQIGGGWVSGSYTWLEVGDLVGNMILNPELPTVSTQAMSNISGSTATGHGNITDVGSGVDEHGHCWSTSQAPTTADSKTENGPGSAGAFTSSLTGLPVGTKHYVRAYAINSEGTSYGAEVSFYADQGNQIFPFADKMRVSSIRRIYRPGYYRMILGLGDIGLDIDMAEAYVRQELNTQKDAETNKPVGEPPEPVEETVARATEEARTQWEKEDAARRAQEELRRASGRIPSGDVTLPVGPGGHVGLPPANRFEEPEGDASITGKVVATPRTRVILGREGRTVSDYRPDRSTAAGRFFQSAAETVTSAYETISTAVGGFFGRLFG